MANPTDKFSVCMKFFFIKDWEVTYHGQVRTWGGPVTMEASYGIMAMHGCWFPWQILTNNISLLRYHFLMLDMVPFPNSKQNLCSSDRWLENSSEKGSDSNLGLLGKKHQCYLCAMQPPPFLSWHGFTCRGKFIKSKLMLNRPTFAAVCRTFRGGYENSKKVNVSEMEP